MLPKALTLGPGEVQGSMEGSHTNPSIQATWQVPVAEASGQVKLDKDSMHLSAKYTVFTTAHAWPRTVSIRIIHTIVLCVHACDGTQLIDMSAVGSTGLTILQKVVCTRRNAMHGPTLLSTYTNEV